jgi:multiple sugar transport system permease protein
MKEKTLIKILKTTGAAGLFIFCLFPFVWMMIISLNDTPDFLNTQNEFIITFKNYIDVLTTESAHLIDYLRNSMIVSLVAAIFATIIAGLSAYAITRLEFRGRYVIPLVLLGISMFPQISIIGYLFEMMVSLGWINTYPALIFPYITLSLPLALWIMLSYLSQISKELDDAALADGATRFQIFRKIIIPVSLPGFFSTLMLIFIFCFNEFLFALMLTIDHNARTIPVGIALFEGLHGQVPWGQIMAASVIAIIPVLILISFFQRYIIGGLTRGAVKG